MQGNNDNDIELINFLKNVICNEIPEPVVFYIDTSSNECKRRLKFLTVRMSKQFIK